MRFLNANFYNIQSWGNSLDVVKQRLRGELVLNKIKKIKIIVIIIV